MGRPRRAESSGGRTLDLGQLNPKQEQFYKSKAKYTAYGGARGGGKTHAIRIKAVMGALTMPGIKILIIRRTYAELQSNHIEPILALGLEPDLAVYNRQLHKLYFHNGSTITFGHFNSYDTAFNEYQGQEFDWIFFDEATQFTEKEFRLMGGCLRGVNQFPKRFYLTCNPGGVGHRWVKRLFIDRDFKQSSENPEENEDPEDYTFIQATVDDNTALMNSEGGREYLKSLSQLPENIRAAHRYGDWNVLSGNYFPEFSEGKHVCAPFAIPRWWKRYRAFDYGLDMLACFWVAVDEHGRAYVYRELYQKDLVVSDAARVILENTGPTEKIAITFAPPDLWARQKDTGKSMAELFMVNGLPIVKASNNRVQGWLQLKEFLKDQPDGKPGMVFFNNCKRICEELAEIQTDDNNPNDVAKEPHDITHGCVTGDTLIATPKGYIPISELTEPGECYAYDGEKLVLDHHDGAIVTNPAAEVYEIELDTGEKIKATADHPVLTAAGWKQVKDLTLSDDILCVAPLLHDFIPPDSVGL